MTPEANRALVARYADEVWNRGNLAALDEFVAPDYVLQETPEAEPIRGPEGLRVYVRSLLAAFPDQHLHVEDMAAESDLVAWRWTMTGTHEGPFLGIPATGRAVRTTGIAMYRLRAGQIVERHGEVDILGLLEQIADLPFGSTRGITDDFGPTSAPDPEPARATTAAPPRPSVASGSAPARPAAAAPSRPSRPPSSAPVVVADNLTKRFGAVTAVDGVTFELRPGCVTGFLGPNGAGKTTTLRMLLGLVTPTVGRALVLGRPYSALENPRRAVGALLESSRLHPARTGRDHLRIIAASAGLPASRVDAVLDTTGLRDAARRRVGGYSLGMRQRLGLAAALLGDPGILILDEPANGLDPAGARVLRGMLRALADDGRAVLVSSHLLAEVEQLVDDVLILDRGRLIAHAPLAELLGGGGATLVASRDDARLAAAVRRRGGEVQPAGDRRLRVAGLAPEDIARLAAAEDVALHELRPVDSDLETLFLRYTEETA
jgi:ABC-2 type transport system ATP-binding protein